MSDKDLFEDHYFLIGDNNSTTYYNHNSDDNNSYIKITKKDIKMIKIDGTYKLVRLVIEGDLNELVTITVTNCINLNYLKIKGNFGSLDEIVLDKLNTNNYKGALTFDFNINNCPLTKFTLRNTSISELDNIETCLKSLEYVDVSHNAIHCIDFPVNLPNITYFNCSNNYLKEILFIDRLPNIRQFIANNNYISRVEIPKEFNPKIKKLNLNNNQIIYFYSACDFTNNLDLDLSNNFIKIFFIPYYSKLNILNLERNFIYNIKYIDVRNVKVLKLSYNLITTEEDKYYDFISKYIFTNELEVLYIDNNPITRLKLGRYDSLKELHISKNYQIEKESLMKVKEKYKKYMKSVRKKYNKMFEYVKSESEKSNEKYESEEDMIYSIILDTDYIDDFQNYLNDINLNNENNEIQIYDEDFNQLTFDSIKTY